MRVVSYEHAVRSCHSDYALRRQEVHACQVEANSALLTCKDCLKIELRWINHILRLALYIFGKNIFLLKPFCCKERIFCGSCGLCMRAISRYINALDCLVLAQGFAKLLCRGCHIYKRHILLSCHTLHNPDIV